MTDQAQQIELLSARIFALESELRELRGQRRVLKRREAVPRSVGVARTLARNQEIRRLRREEKLPYAQLAALFNLSAHYLPSIIERLDYEDRMAPLMKEIRERQAREA
jgi:hypothetical protein